MFQALAHSRLVKQSEDWHREVKQQEKLGSSGIHWVTQPKPPLLFHFSAPISGIYYHTLFYPLNAWTGHSGTNHNHYNFFKCDWCISCIIFLLSFCTALIGQRNWKVGCNRTSEIGQLKQPVILSPLSQIHQSQN